ncbi:hypothetical protein [Dyella sp.]|uniref:hypothetical protein n=1 Tax=Dyella sp. TaxID=1869338 RepID=UPI00284E1130|nr:hypothetical protein [Dyella sp.]MDR3446007.1 hypothetical protein [Dyella sp.]
MEIQTPSHAIERLRAWATKATLVGASATKARSHIDLALISAEHGHLPPGVVDDLNEAARLLERVGKSAENFRLRKLRKADRKEQANV